MYLLALSGNLRTGWFSTSALRKLEKLVPEGVALTLHEDIRALPHLNPDVEMSALPDSVSRFRQHVAAADGLVIAYPEYAHGIPGSFKNALDWLVGSESFSGKPVMFINTAPRASHAQAQLVEVLTTMSANVVHEAGFTVDLRVADALQTLRAGLMAFAGACENTAAQP